MGEKEIRPTGPALAGGQVATAPKPGVPQTVEKPGTGGTIGDGLRAAGLGGLADALDAVSKAEQDAWAKSGAWESPPLAGGWRTGQDASGHTYAVDQNGVRGNWDPANHQFTSPTDGKPFPKSWGAGLIK